MSWFLYLIECADGSVYTGITTDVAARFDEHAAGKGARYTRSRKPRAVLASFPLADRSSALRAEYRVKQLTAAQKRELAAGKRTLESVLPVVAAIDANTGESGEESSSGKSRKRAKPATGAAADDADSNAAVRKRGRAAAKTSTPRAGSAAKATSAQRPTSKKQASATGATPDAAKPRIKAPTTGRTAARKSKAPPNPAAKSRSTGRAASASAPKKTARAKQNRAAS
ncbi:GIY-YIG nuclease family protein [Burkholderia sp. MR1-5-21]